MGVFAAAIFLGAFLLFLVQPLMGRFLLPWFGGSPGIWTVCLLFFQTALFVGYAYAHLLTRWVKGRRQVFIHLGLVTGALLALPPIPLQPDPTRAAQQPIRELLQLLVTSIGPLFVLLSATGPLIQRWFYQTHPSRSPYPLYALSNLGSLLALAAYPLLLEPLLPRQSQAEWWSWGFVLFGVILAACLWAHKQSASTLPTEEIGSNAAATRVTWGMRLRWIAWAAIGTGMLAAITATISADVAPVPFLWLTPIAIYLVSFIVTFSSRSWYRRVPLAALLMIAATLSSDLRIYGLQMEFFQLLGTNLFILAVACLVCHGELYEARPPAIHLTDYYLTIAAGGALGTLWVAIISPSLTNLDWDLPLLWLIALVLVSGNIHRTKNSQAAWALFAGLLVAIVVAPTLRPDFWVSQSWTSIWSATTEYSVLPWVLAGGLILLWFTWRTKRFQPWNHTTGLAALGVPLLFATFYLKSSFEVETGTVSRVRGFHGLVTVVDKIGTDPRANARFMNHGTTTHGIQLTHPDYRGYPTSYYDPNSGIGRALSRANQKPGRTMGVVGLGIGTLAAYGMEQDFIRFFEIDPHVIEIAKRDFDFISGSDAEIDIVLGDGRLALLRESKSSANRPYDLLILDAFSGDAVPIHLLTAEAFSIYRQRLAPNGLLAINISNRVVDIRRAIEGNIAQSGFYLAHMIHQPDGTNWWQFSSEWLLLAPRRETLDTPKITEWTGIAGPQDLGDHGWTDEFASLLPMLR